MGIINDSEARRGVYGGAKWFLVNVCRATMDSVYCFSACSLVCAARQKIWCSPDMASTSRLGLLNNPGERFFVSMSELKNMLTLRYRRNSKVWWFRLLAMTALLCSQANNILLTSRTQACGVAGLLREQRLHKSLTVSITNQAFLLK